MCAPAREREAAETPGVGSAGPNPTAGSTVGNPDLSPDCVSPQSRWRQPCLTEAGRKFDRSGVSADSGGSGPVAGPGSEIGSDQLSVKKTKPRLPAALGPVRDLAP